MRNPFTTELPFPPSHFGQLRDFLDNSLARFAVPCLTPRDTNSEADAAFDTAMFFFACRASFSARQAPLQLWRRRPQDSSRSGSGRLQEAPSLERRAWREELLPREENVFDDASVVQWCSDVETARDTFFLFFHKHRAGL